MRPSFTERRAVSFACAIATLIACTGLPATSLRAQRPAGADTLSPAAVAESLKVLAQIRRQLEKDRNNAPLWYHRGMLAWALYDRDRTEGGLKNLESTALYREADSSIRIANRIARDSVRYRLTLGQFYMGSGYIPLRVQAYLVFDGALKLARTMGDSSQLSELLIEKGRIHWRRYDPSEYGTVPADVRQQARELLSDSSKHGAIAHDIDSITDDVPLTREALRVARAQLQEEFRRGDAGFTNEIDYKKAEEYFREAMAVAPASARAYQQLAMLLAERERWRELGAMARARLGQDPTDAWALMTSALAAYRTGNDKYAQATFDSGFKMLSPRDRNRLDNLERMLRPSDVSTFAGWTDAERAAYTAKYWTWSTPLWSQNTVSPRLEFLARVTYAELRWTVDELRARGADSDRGRVYIRYGPPDARATLSGYFQQLNNVNLTRQDQQIELGGDVESWWYDFARMTFHFKRAPTFGTSFFVNPVLAYERMDSIPSRWDNIARVRVDSLPVRVTRFRASADSVDVVFTSQPPVEAIQAAASIEGAVRTDFWLLDNDLRPWVHDSGTTTAGGSRAFVRRLAAGDYTYRFEASSESSLRAARALSSMAAKEDPATDFRLSGFGMSDVLLGTRVAPRGQGRRWKDFDYDASAGSIAQGTEVALLWENYDFGEKDGAASYQITFSIERKYQRLLDRVRARIVSSFSTMVGNEQTEDRVIYRYERTTPHAPVITDFITLVLTDLPSGSYDMKLEMLDRVTGRTTEKTTRVVIRD